MFGLVACLFMGAQLLMAQTQLTGDNLTKWRDPLPTPGKLTGTNLTIGMYQVQQYIHKDFEPGQPWGGTTGLKTTFWGYGTSQATASFPAATIEATKGVPTYVKWENHLPTTHLLSSVIDHTLHMAMPMSGVPAVVHLHGGEVEPQSDGGPDAWFTQGFAEKGIDWQKETYEYVNEQLPTTLWYHDHVLGLTRLNVYTGLAGFYLLRDPATEAGLNLPTGEYEREIVIQDRMLNTDGSLRYEVDVTNPTVHPQWGPEFFGDIIVVNGKAWPYLEVKPRKYRFRLLNGSNSRFYNLSFENGLTFKQIGTDGGYLRAPVTLSSLLIAPGERADIIVDFSGFTAGAEFLLTNDANSPFPDGDPIDATTTAQIMKIKVVAGSPDGLTIPTTLNNIPVLTNACRTRSLTLNEVMGQGGPLVMFLDGKRWDAPVSELPVLGSTEIWEIINLTADTHPIHLHLVQFQLLNRQSFDAAGYEAAYAALNPVLPTDNPIKPDLAPFLIGTPTGPDPNEDGWKDTFRMNPGEVTRVIVRFQPIATPLNTNADFVFDATAEPGYVWHCHIIEHEDNEMMRPYKLTRFTVSVNSPTVCANELPATMTATVGGNTAPPFTYSWTGPGGFTSTANPISVSVPGTYYVTVTESNGCSTTGSGILTVNPLPVVNAGPDRSIGFTQAVTLGGNPTASGNGPFTYNWTATPPDPTLTNVANPQVRPQTTTTYTVTVTDNNGCQASDQVTITVYGFVFLADDYIKINQNKTSDGNIHSNDKIEFGVGAPGIHTGNLTAVDDITIRNKNTINGNVKAGDEIFLFGNAKVNGTKTAHASVKPIEIPVISFTAGGPSKTVAKNKTLSLAPGSYGTVKVFDKATLILSAGEYFMKVLDTEPAAIISCDVSNGPIDIHVVNNLDFATRVKVKITGTGAATEKVTFLTLQSPKMDIGPGATIQGTIIAKNAEVHFSSSCLFKGAVVTGGAITLDPKVLFSFHSASVLTKSVDEDFEAEAPAASAPVTSYQLEQNYPNPFNPSTRIAFSLLEAGTVQLSVYNLQGQEVRTLVSGQMNPGHHTINWNGRDTNGKLMPSGVYLYKLQVNGFAETRRMTLMK